MLEFQDQARELQNQIHKDYLKNIYEKQEQELKAQQEAGNIYNNPNYHYSQYNTCPNCGYCRHCGRGNHYYPRYPEYWCGVGFLSNTAGTHMGNIGPAYTKNS